MIIHIFIIILIIFSLVSVSPPAEGPGVKFKKPAPQKTDKVKREEAPIYRDGSLTVFLKGRALTVQYHATGETSAITLSAPGGQNVPVHLKNKKPSVKRKMNTLLLTCNGFIYSISTGPPAALSAIYPDPGSDGDKIIVDKNKNVLYLYKNGDPVRAYRVATGERPEYTPEGKFMVINKFAIPPDPDKARFGPRWLGIGVPSHYDLRSEKPDQRAPSGIKYGIHGTDEPESLGTYASGGCVRLDNDDIMELYDLVNVNIPVEIIR